MDRLLTGAEEAVIAHEVSLGHYYSQNFEIIAAIRKASKDQDVKTLKALGRLLEDRIIKPLPDNINECPEIAITLREIIQLRDYGVLP